VRSKIEQLYISLVKRAQSSLLFWVFLSPLMLCSLVFGVVIFVRRKVLTLIGSRRKVAAPIITVGNVTVGGTGKTPMILSLLAHLTSDNLKIAYVSRGYRRKKGGLRVGYALDPKEIGDEASLVQRRNENVIVSISDDKWEAVQAVEKERDLIILDDSLQRYDIPVDLTIATIDCLCPDGYGWLLPRGTLREPFSRLQEMDFLVLTNAINQEVLDRAVKMIKKFNIPFIVTQPHITRFFTSDGSSYNLRKGTPVALFSSIAHPKRFSASVQKAGYSVIATMEALDHVDIKSEKLIQWARRVQALCPEVVFVGTEKDWARKCMWPILPSTLLFSQMELEIVGGNENFYALIDRVRTMTNRQTRL